MKRQTAIAIQIFALVGFAATLTARDALPKARQSPALSRYLMLTDGTEIPLLPAGLKHWTGLEGNGYKNPNEDVERFFVSEPIPLDQPLIINLRREAITPPAAPGTQPTPASQSLILTDGREIPLLPTPRSYKRIFDGQGLQPREGDVAKFFEPEPTALDQPRSFKLARQLLGSRLDLLSEHILSRPK